MSRCKTNSVTVSFFCFLTHAPTVCACARGMYVRNPPFYSIPSFFPLLLLLLFLLFLLLCSHTNHRIALHRIARHSSFSRLQFIKIYNDLFFGFHY